MLEVRNGEMEKLGVLYERHRTTLFNFFVRLTGSYPMSEDLVQDVFLRMLKYRQTFEAGNRFTTWMYQIARNVHFDSFRKREPEISMDASEMEAVETQSPGLSPDQNLRAADR